MAEPADALQSLWANIQQAGAKTLADLSGLSEDKTKSGADQRAAQAAAKWDPQTMLLMGGIAIVAVVLVFFIAKK